MKIAFLGPMGTFCNEAANIISKDDELIPYLTIYDTIEAVNTSKCDLAVVPVENSTEGAVNLTVDTIIFEADVYIQKEIILPIRQFLIGKENTDIKNIEKIYSHPQALAQCRHYLRDNFANTVLISTNSTASAVENVANSDKNICAIGTKFASKIYNLKCLKENIQDRSDNFTKFIVLSKQNTVEPKENSKLTVAFSTVNKPGELYKILDIFSIWDVNMTQIISRPYLNKSGNYVFYIDLDCDNILDMKDCIKMLKRKTEFFKILGSYKIDDYR